MASSSLRESTASIGESSFRETDIDDGFVRISKLAIISAVLAVFSAFALIATSFLPVCFLALILGIVSAVRIVRNSSLGGIRFSYFGIALSAAVGAWSLTADLMRTNYLYRVAAGHAESYLQVLSAGDTYQALELRKLEPNRQIAGTKLELVYQGGTESEALNEFRRFVDRPVTDFILAAGPEANWEFVSGEGVEQEDVLTKVTVKMRNVAEPGSSDVLVTMGRVAGLKVSADKPAAALWYVTKDALPGED